MTLKKDNWGNQEIPGISNEELLSKEFAKKIRSAEQSERSKLLATDPQWIAIHNSSIKKRDQDPNYHKTRNQALSKTYQDTVWRENVARANKAKPLDPAYKAAHQASYTPEANKRRSDSVREAYKKDPMLGVNSSRRGKAMWTTQEHRTKIQQCVLTPLGVFESHTKAADAYGIGRGAFSNKFKREQAKDPINWRNITLEEFAKLKKSKSKPTSVVPSFGAPKYVKTNFGVFRGLAEAGRFAKELGIPNARKWVSIQLKEQPNTFYFISKEEYEEETK